MKINLHDTTGVPVYKRVSYLYIPALFVVTSIVLEVIMFITMGIAFPKAYIFSLSIILIIASLVALSSNKILQTIICSLLFACQLTTSISNIFASTTCNEIFSLETLKTITTAFNATSAVQLGFLFLIPIGLLVVAYVVAIVLVILFCNTVNTRHSNWGQSLICGILAFVSFFSYTVSYSGLPNYQHGTDYYVENLTNEKFLYDTFSNRASSLRTFGSYSYYLDNFLKLLGVKTSANYVIGEKVNPDFQPNEFSLDSDETLGEGYNLIMILMETFERAAINPVTMPNLYQFMQESCVEVDGYYSIERTCFTDHISQTGMHDAGKEFWNNYGNVAIPHSLANIFDRSSYQTSAFHDFNGKFYNRKKIFTENLGFQNFYDYKSYKNKIYDSDFALNSDKILFEENLSKIAPTDTNFYSYMISVSTHALNSAKYNLGDYYPEIFSYLEQPENWEALQQIYPVLATGTARQVLAAKNYLAGTYNFDQGFGALLNYLKTTTGKDGKLLIETTALVMFGDHYYYVNPKTLSPENDNPSELVGNRSPFIVYNPKQKVEDPTTHTLVTQAENALKSEPEKYGSTKRRFTSTMDIYPTVCSLFGIQTDQQLTYGHSIFADDEQSIGVGYLGGFTWGALGYDGVDVAKYQYQGVEYQTEKANWLVWRTLDFVSFRGVQLTSDQIKDVSPLVNRTYASIFLDTSLYDKNGFKDLAKSYAYRLKTA